jgi:hypothetical protein
LGAFPGHAFIVQGKNAVNHTAGMEYKESGVESGVESVTGMVGGWKWLAIGLIHFCM